MKITKPNYYPQFRCLAAACPDSCCHEWEVDIDDETAARYLSLPGDLGDRLRQVLRREDECWLMTIEDSRCPMWRQDGLCRIQAELGHDALSRVCREYPRLKQDYGDFQEWSLELSCPEAARLILTQDPGLAEYTTPETEAADYDPQIMEALRQSRAAALSYLDSGRHTVPETLAVLLLYAYEVQTCLDGGEMPAFDPEKCLLDARRYAAAADPNALLGFFRQLEILTDRWRSRLDTPSPVRWSDAFRPLIRYFINRWWLQAVWDFDLVCRVKFMVSACILIRLLGGELTETCQLFSKETENDPDNLDALFDGAYASPALTDINLLSLLFSESSTENL